MKNQTNIKEGVKIENEVNYDSKYHFLNDMSILIINHFIQSVLDKNLRPVYMICTHSTDTLRAIRYLKELEIDHILLNNENPLLNDTIKRNLILNNIEDKNFTLMSQDPRLLLYSQKDSTNIELSKRISLIDIIPNESVSIYLEGSIESISEGGMICITAKDIEVLGGIYPEKCLSQYESYPIKNKDYCHELSIRTLLFALSKHAAMHKKIIKPLISYYSDGYIRLFVQVSKSRGDISIYPLKIGYVEQCSQCSTYNISPLSKISKSDHSKYEITPSVHSNCSECESYLKLGGPIWIDSIHDKQFVSSLISKLNEIEDANQFKYYKKMKSLLNCINEEIEYPLFYSLASISKKLNVRIPSKDLVKEIIAENGYEVSNSHLNRNSIKTNAPPEILWDIFRDWCLKEKPFYKDKMDRSSAMYKIMSKESKRNIFDKFKPETNKLGSNYIEKKYYNVSILKNTMSKLLHKIK